MKNRKNLKILFGFIIVLLILITSNVYAIDYDSSYSLTPSEYQMYDSLEYVLDKYDININVNENNTLDITETITANFKIPKHGIYRTIPLKNDITRLDGTTSKNRTKVTNLSVDNEYTTSRENNNLKIKIGSPNYTLTG